MTPAALGLQDKLIEDMKALKRARGLAVVAHSYVSADIVQGVADLVGDSYQISVQAKNLPQKTILFAGVRFMAETIKLLNPEKRVFMTRQNIGCSLAESVTAQDVRDIKARHPGVPVVAYVNTTAEVKAEVDAVCTSANAAKVVEAMAGPEVIYLPDKYMARNLKTSKRIIPWEGRCVVHEHFDTGILTALRSQHPQAYIMAHPECPEEVAVAADFVGSTGQMLDQARRIPNTQIVLLTECGLGDRLRVALPEKEVLGTCRLCPYMKENFLQDLVDVAEDLGKGFEIIVHEDIAPRARRALERMVAIVEGPRD